MLKIMQFCNFINNFLQIFENSSASWGSPRTPYEADPLNAPPKQNPADATGWQLYIKFSSDFITYESKCALFFVSLGEFTFDKNGL